MRKDNSRRNRKDSDEKNKPERFERSNFRKSDDDKKPEGNSSERPVRNFRTDKPRSDSPAFGQKRSYRGKSNESPSYKPARNFRDDKPKDEPLSFDQKKKYTDRSAKIEKNKRKRDFGQSFTNKPDTRNEGTPSEKRESRPFHGNKRNKFDHDRKPFRSGRKFSSTEKKADDGLIRLNKYIANSGICSRREADDMISAGVISVNGEIITKLGTKISATDVVKYNNETMRRERNMYLLLNKPKDFITTVEDPENRNTVMSLISGACKERIYPVGRLDRNTTGVLLFTNDGEMTKRLTHPSSNVKKVYHVELDKNVTAADIEKIAAGIELEDGLAKVDEIAYDSPTDKSHIGIELHSGKNRIVRRIFETLDYRVKKLDRVFFAGLTKKDLPRGRWRFLTEMEVNNLKMQVGGKKVYSE